MPEAPKVESSNNSMKSLLWIALGVIVLATIIGIVCCMKKKASAMKESIQGATGFNNGYNLPVNNGFGNSAFQPVNNNGFRNNNFSPAF